MGADNVDIFQKVVFSLPPLRTQFPAIVGLSFVYSAVAFVAFRVFTPLSPSLSTILWVAVVVFLVPFVAAAELFHRALPDYPRRWSYFLSLSNQFVLFLYGLVLSGANNPGNAWSIVWLTFITIYLINVLVLIVSIGAEHYRRILLVSLTQPAALIAIFYTFADGMLDVSTYRHAFGFASFLVAAAFLLLALLSVDYLIKSNTDVSAFTLTSGILQNNRERLDLGFEAEPDVQTLEIDNGERLTLAAPWVHPGPLGGFGGGQLSGTVIEELNDGGTGFFLHVPCTHEEDLADPDDAEKILEAVAEPDRGGRASKLLQEDYGSIEFYGRRIDGRKVIFLHAEAIDDYDPGVFMRDVDKDEVLLVDLHRHDIQKGPDKEIQYGTAEADELKRHFDDFRAKLDEAPLDDYRAGFAVRRSSQDLMAAVERVGEQEVLLMGVDTNGVTRDLRELQERYRSEFDHVLLFSTDTHASIHELANMTRSNVDAMREAIESAAADVAPATVGLTNRKAKPLDLLKNDYNGLVFSVNILIRLAILMLVLLYVLLVIWIF
jgi:putative membrane protein